MASPSRVLPQIGRYQASMTDPDQATAETVRLMCEHIARAAEDPEVQRVAMEAVRRFRGGPTELASGQDPTAPINVAKSAWWYAKHRLKFEHHEKMIRVMFGESGQLQLLISPEILVRLSRPKGDCAIYVLLVCAILKCWGVPYEIVTAACDPSEPGIFSHVFCYAVLPDGTRLPLDASHGKYPGWQVPFAHRSRTQVWNENGNPVADHPTYQGLGAYIAPAKGYRPKLRVIRGGMAGWSRRGLGQDDGTDLTSLPTIDTGLTTGIAESNLEANVNNPLSATGASNLSPSQLSSLSTATQNYFGTTTTPSSNPFSSLVNVLSGAAQGAANAYNATQAAQANAANVAAWTNILIVGGLIVGGVMLISVLKK
jgi:hypothetical protein